jgi:cytochrome c oxidase subunit III
MNSAVAPAQTAWALPYRGKVGMAGLIAAESAIFTIFVVAYLFYLGKSLSGPMPKDVLEPPLFYSACLLSSSLTIHLAVRALSRGNYPRFLLLWLFTMVLGGLFLFGTAREWHRLIYEHGLKISTNLFGTTYYSLVGLHGFHVSAGLLMLAVALLLAVFGQIRREHTPKVDVLAMYWHFVDAIWVVVFTVVYIVGR